MPSEHETSDAKSNYTRFVHVCGCFKSPALRALPFVKGGKGDFVGDYERICTKVMWFDLDSGRSLPSLCLGEYVLAITELDPLPAASGLAFDVETRTNHR